MNPLEVLQQAKDTLTKLESQKEYLKTYLLKNISTQELSKQDKERFTQGLSITDELDVHIQYLDKKDKKYYESWEVFSLDKMLVAIKTHGEISYFDIINFKLWKP